MKLVYIHYVGKNFEREHIYEFLFVKDNVERVAGEDWDSRPANGNPQPPINVDLVARFSSKLFFEVIQESSVFSMQDAIDGLIAMAWEDLDVSIYEDVDPPVKKMFFKFGEAKEDIDLKFYERDLSLTYNKNGTF